MDDRTSFLIVILSGAKDLLYSLSPAGGVKQILRRPRRTPQNTGHPRYLSGLLGMRLIVLLGVLLWVAPVWAQRSGNRSPDQFDPLGFPGDDSVVTAGAHPAIPELPVTVAPVADSIPAEPRVHEFWQVQFYATPDWTEADDLRQRAQEALQDTVSVDFETPYYKLRVGQFSERDEADKLVVKLRAMGYESAWVVRREGGDGPR